MKNSNSLPGLMLMCAAVLVAAADRDGNQAAAGKTKRLPAKRPAVAQVKQAQRSANPELNGDVAQSQPTMLLAQKEAGKKSKKVAETSAKEDKPRLPRYFGKLELSEAQREKVHTIQAKYTDEIAKLEKQLADVKTKRDNELQKVLNASQKKQYSEAVEAAKAKSTKRDADEVDE